MTKIYACKTGACAWHGSIEGMDTVECPLCGEGRLKYIGDTPDEEDGRVIFQSVRTRDREGAMDDKTEKKRPGFFERVGEKVFFRRS